MKNNLASELEWLTQVSRVSGGIHLICAQSTTCLHSPYVCLFQNREAAKNAGFLYSVDSHSSTGGINLQIESGDAAVEGVCMSFADLCGSNKAKLGLVIFLSHRCL